MYERGNERILWSTGRGLGRGVDSSISQHQSRCSKAQSSKGAGSRVLGEKCRSWMGNNSVRYSYLASPEILAVVTKCNFRRLDRDVCDARLNTPGLVWRIGVYFAASENK